MSKRAKIIALLGTVALVGLLFWVSGRLHPNDPLNQFRSRMVSQEDHYHAYKLMRPTDYTWTHAVTYRDLEPAQAEVALEKACTPGAGWTWTEVVFGGQSLGFDGEGPHQEVHIYRHDFGGCTIAWTHHLSVLQMLEVRIEKVGRNPFVSR